MNEHALVAQPAESGGLVFLKETTTGQGFKSPPRLHSVSH